MVRIPPFQGGGPCSIHGGCTQSLHTSSLFFEILSWGFLILFGRRGVAETLVGEVLVGWRRGGSLLNSSRCQELRTDADGCSALLDDV